MLGMRTRRAGRGGAKRSLRKGIPGDPRKPDTLAIPSGGVMVARCDLPSAGLPGRELLAASWTVAAGGGINDGARAKS